MAEFWQDRLFQHTFDLWEPARTQNAAGRPSTPTYTKTGSAVACYLNRNPSTSDLDAALGRFEQDIIFTLDVLWLTYDQDVGEGWVAVNKTTLSDGSNHPNYGEGWIIRGEPRRITSMVGVGMGHTECYASMLAELPSGVS